MDSSYEEDPPTGPVWVNNSAVFIDLTLEDQAYELRAHLKQLGAEISEEMSPKGIEDDLHKIIGVCDVSFTKDPKELNDTDIESALNAIVSMLILIPLERAENLILAFSEKLAKAPGYRIGNIALKVLWLLFQSLDPRSTMRYHVYYHLIQIAKNVEQIRSIFKGVDDLRKQFSACEITTEQMQKLLRLLHEVLLLCGESELAAKVMVELLGTYTKENASHAREDAQRCILTALADPGTFLLDPLLSLKPVHFLKGELIHDLLTIFVSEKLADYVEFYRNHKEFITNQGLNHEQNMTKMRLLTFMQLAENAGEVTFDTITSELQIEEKEVEAFIIDVLKTKLVRARMDQAARKVYIGSSMHRTFGHPQWQQLRDVLFAWKTAVQHPLECMATIAEAQLTCH
ncbi:hypothetical protein AAG570_002963 [Ranatra chinensis]|uniref:Eukaryotic translation initiation factor 3 subunit M n=1 Tax=Ranatra chinensis TaxID=642074 RepID=A0ABD0Y5D8_9HEMI